MTSQTLRDARKYEEVSGKMITEEQRPAFHLSTRTGWMNDPNGFSFYDGKYHLFYQYHPYDCHWGPMHWGHAVSGDLLHWEYLPAALAPDEDYDRDGCYSGSALTLPDGRQLLMYTGVKKESKSSTKELQRQCLAVGNGVDYEKYGSNPVLDGDDLPKGSSLQDFRDPKMWVGADGVYRVIAGNRAADGRGQIPLFTSTDGFRWKFKKLLAVNDGRFGLMWECPDFFTLGGKGVLIVSPQEMLPEGFEYHNGNGTLCLIGDYDEKTDTFAEQHDQAIDYGIDFYAPQTLLAPDGRRIMIGWMQNWDTISLHEKEQPWFGQMSLPRELSIKNGRLYQQPVRELERLRGGRVEHRDVVFEGALSLDGVRGRRIDMEIELAPGDRENLYQKFAVRFAQNERYHTSFSFRPRESILKVDRKFSGTRKAVIHQRRSLVNSENGRLKLRLILDRFSAELFVNGGEQTMTVTIYTDPSAEGISFFADGKVRMSVVKYNLI